MFVDKTVKTAMKTSKGVSNATVSLVKSTKDIAVNTTVNFTPDLYDEHQDFSKGAALSLIGNSVMAGRNVIRSSNNLRSGWKYLRIKKIDRNIKKLEKDIKTEKHSDSQEQSFDEKIKSFRNRTKYREQTTYKHTTFDTQTTKNRKSKVESNNAYVDKQIKLRKLQVKKKRFEKKRSKLKQKTFHPISSTKATISNQTRKQASVLSNKDDFGTQAIGMSMKGVWATKKYWKYVKSVISIPKRAVEVTCSIIGMVITIVSSIPAIISSIVALFPFLLIIMVVVIILSIFGVDNYSGRIGILYSKIDELNQIYQVDVDPAEVLAITDILEWTNIQDEESYEQLFSLMHDQKRENPLTFDEMVKNVFIVYNPANIYKSDAIYQDNYDTGFDYWSLEGINLGYLIDNPDQKNLWYKEHLELYPMYRAANKGTREKMAKSDYQMKLIENAKNSIEKNRQKYEDYVYEYNLGNIDIDVTGDNEKGVIIVQKALSKLGCHYVWGAGHSTQYNYKDPKLKYFDCSGLICWSYYQAGIDIGNMTTTELYRAGLEVPRSKIQPGDIIVYLDRGNAGHVVLYASNNKIIHAPNESDVVKIADATYYLNQDGAKIRRLY